jgi:hypothetical protein
MLNRIDKDTHTNKLQLLFWKHISKNYKVKRAWLGAMGDRLESSSRVCMSEDKVHKKGMCCSVRRFLESELPGVGGPGLGEAGCYRVRRQQCRGRQSGTTRAIFSSGGTLWPRARER